VLHAIADELHKFGFESALLLAGPEGLTLAHMSHKRPVIDQAMKLIGIRKMSEVLPIDPSKSPMLDTLLKSPEPMVEVRPHALIRAIWGKRAPESVREKLIEILQLSHVVAAGEFGHHPAVFGVQGDLAVDRLGAQAVRAAEGGVEDRHAGLVAGGFDAEDAHAGIR